MGLYHVFALSSVRLWILCCIALFNALCLSTVIPMLYQVIKYYHGSSWHMGIVFALFSLAQIIFTPLIGRIADIVGKKIVLLASLFASSCSALIQAFAPSLSFFMIGRFLDGATGSTNALSQAMINSFTNEDTKHIWFARYHVMYSIGFIVGPLIPYFFSSQPLYVPFMFLCFLAIILGFLVFVSFDNDTQSYQEAPIKSRSFVVREIWSSQRMRMLIIVHGIIACVAAMFQVAIQPYVTYTFDDGATLIPFIFIIGGIINVCSVPLITILTKRFPSLSLLIGTCIVRCVGYLLLIFIVDRWFFWVLIVIFSFVNLCSRSVVSHLVGRVAHRHNLGLVFGMIESVGGVGMLIGPLVYSGIMIVTELGSWHYILSNTYALPFLFMLGLCIGVSIYCMYSRLLFSRLRRTS